MLPARLIALFAVACGFSVANIYYAQPLIAQIAPDLGLSPGIAGLVMTLTQLGYGAGLLFVVPLADLVENRRLTIVALGGVALGLVGAFASRGPLTFLIASFVIGVGATATQVLVPFASHLAPEASRGRVVGNVMAGTLAGIMLARPFSSFVASIAGWRAVFASSAVFVVLLVIALLRALPTREPKSTLRYLDVMRSMLSLLRTTPILRRRMLYQGMMFGAFTIFWTDTPIVLLDKFGFTQRGVAIFALVGAAGALTAPWAGRLADRGYVRSATRVTLLAAVLALVVTAYGGARLSLIALVVGSLVLDGAVQMCHVLGLRSLYELAPEIRGRVNGLYMSWVFLCGATCSILATALLAAFGFATVCFFAAGLVLVALVVSAFK